LTLANSSHLDWPFLEARHKVLGQAVAAWADQHVSPHTGKDVDSACRKLVRSLGEDGWLKYAIGGTKFGALSEVIDARAVCIIRETLAYRCGLADFSFALQGLGSGAISLFGTAAQKQKYLPRVAAGTAIAAFALSEPDAGSDVAAMQCEAKLHGDTYELNGEKTWISNGGIADFYVLFARTGEKERSHGITAFIVEPDSAGFEVAERIEVMAPHPLARLRFNKCRIPSSARLGESGQGFKVAMATLDIFRTSVAAAALGFARRALAEALGRVTTRNVRPNTG